jgi:hypothetical protein
MSEPANVLDVGYGHKRVVNGDGTAGGIAMVVEYTNQLQSIISDVSA